MPTPRKAFDARGQQRIDKQFLGQLALHQHAIVVTQQGAHRFL